MEFKFPPRRRERSTSESSDELDNDGGATPGSDMRLDFALGSPNINRVSLSREPSDSLSSTIFSTMSTVSITDPLLIHPVFINSDLTPNARFYNFKELYPVERLNPVCMGYFNYPEYEAAMSSINAAEAMLRDPEGYQLSRRLSTTRTLRQRRSTSNPRFSDKLILERSKLSFWRNKDARLTVNTDLISAQQALRSMEPFMPTPTSTYSRETRDTTPRGAQVTPRPQLENRTGTPKLKSFLSRGGMM